VVDQVSHPHKPNIEIFLFRYSQNNQSASYIVGADWLEVWVQLVVKGRNEQYRDAHLTECLLYGLK
jgi:hypothetical protein